MYFSTSHLIYWEIAEFKKLKDLRPLPAMTASLGHVWGFPNASLYTLFLQSVILQNDKN